MRIIDPQTTRSTPLKFTEKTEIFPFMSFDTTLRSTEPLSGRTDGNIQLLMILPWMVRGGADLFNLNLIKGLDNERFDVHVITTYPSDNPLRRDFEEAATSVLDLPTFLSKKDWPSFVEGFISSHGVDLLFITNSYFAYGLLPWIREQHPQLPILDYVHAEYPWREGAYARTTGVMASLLERTYTCNQHTANVLKNKYGRDPKTLSVAYIGVDEEAFNPDSITNGLLKRELALRNDQEILLYPCRIEEEKRPYLLLDILSKLKESRGDHFVVAVVGDGRLLKDMKQRAKKLGLGSMVRFLGSRSQMAELYQDATLTLVTSYTEGLTLTAYESLAMGVPCISSDVGGQRELVSAETGRLIPCQVFDGSHREGEVKGFADAILETTVDTDRYAVMSKNCRKVIMEGFTTKDMNRFFEKEFTDIAHRGAGIRGQETQVALKMLKGLSQELLNLYIRFDQLEVLAEEQRLEIQGLKRGNLPYLMKKALELLIRKGS